VTRRMLQRFTPRLWLASGLIVTLVAGLQGCADYGGGGYGYGYDEDYGVGFYEPYGYYYGGWGGDYHVGPWRDGRDHGHGEGGGHWGHRSMPSIPTRSPGGHFGGGGGRR
jgi:hypothetical protein